MSGIIYKIVCNITGECYIGSTKQRLTKRMSDLKGRPNGGSKQIIERGDFRAEMIEILNVGEDGALKAKEWIEKSDCINKTDNQRNKMRKESKAKSDKKYRSTDNGKESKAKSDKKYREGENREEILAKKREYYVANREIIAIKDKARKPSIACECGGSYKSSTKLRHFSTQKHIRFQGLQEGCPEI
jgi:hypothetical protein